MSLKSLEIDREEIASTMYKDVFKYLGIHYNPLRKTKPNIGAFKETLNRLEQTALKPQQKLCILRSNLLPKYFHQLVLGRLSKGILQQLNLEVPRFIKSIVGLPNDTPNDYFYTKSSEGGHQTTNLRKASAHSKPSNELK